MATEQAKAEFNRLLVAYNETFHTLMTVKNQFESTRQKSEVAQQCWDEVEQIKSRLNAFDDELTALNATPTMPFRTQAYFMRETHTISHQVMDALQSEISKVQGFNNAEDAPTYNEFDPLVNINVGDQQTQAEQEDEMNRLKELEDAELQAITDKQFELVKKGNFIRQPECRQVTHDPMKDMQDTMTQILTMVIDQGNKQKTLEEKMENVMRNETPSNQNVASTSASKWPIKHTPVVPLRTVNAPQGLNANESHPNPSASANEHQPQGYTQQF